VSLQKLIRDIIEESMLIEEDKTSVIKKMTQLTRYEQEQLINLFKSKPHLEKKVKDYNIDWNRYRELSFQDFLPLFEQGSMGAEFKKLKKGKDYIEVLDNSLKDVPGLLGVYVPLNYNTAQVLTKKAGGTKAEWCIGYDGDDRYWYSYTYNISNETEGDGQESVFFIVITQTNKWAIQIHTSNNNNIIIWDKNDHSHRNADDFIPYLNATKLVNKNTRLIDDVREELDKRGEYDERLDFYRQYEEVDPNYNEGDIIDFAPDYFIRNSQDIIYFRLNEDFIKRISETKQKVLSEITSIDYSNDGYTYDITTKIPCRIYSNEIHKIATVEWFDSHKIYSFDDYIRLYEDDNMPDRDMREHIYQECLEAVEHTDSDKLLPFYVYAGDMTNISDSDSMHVPQKFVIASGSQNYTYECTLAGEFSSTSGAGIDILVELTSVMMCRAFDLV
jgi:hypothetical protein